MAELLTFFLVLIFGLIFSELFNRLHLPYVTALIIAGIIIGPFFLNLIQISETVLFLAGIGVIFLMFIAGSEIKMQYIKETRKDIIVITLLNGILPFLTGYFIGTLFGYNFFTSIILGTVFVSSSIAVIIPSLQSIGLTNTRLGKDIISATVLEDIASLLLLAIVLQSFTQKTQIPLPIYIVSIILLIIGLKIFIPKIQEWYTSRKHGSDLFESEIRFVFVVLVATVLLFELMGMHSIIAGFIIGIILGDSVKGKVGEKIKTISYGLFIPIFFIIMGLQTDLSVFITTQSFNIALAILIGLITSKIISGIIAGKLIGFSLNESILLGISTIPQLSTTLAVAFAALEFGLLTPELITSLVFLSIITTLIAPMIINFIVSRKIHEITY